MITFFKKTINYDYKNHFDLSGFTNNKSINEMTPEERKKIILDIFELKNEQDIKWENFIQKKLLDAKTEEQRRYLEQKYDLKDDLRDFRSYYLMKTHVRLKGDGSEKSPEERKRDDDEAKNFCLYLMKKIIRNGQNNYMFFGEYPSIITALEPFQYVQGAEKSDKRYYITDNINILFHECIDSSNIEIMSSLLSRFSDYIENIEIYRYIENKNLYPIFYLISKGYKGSKLNANQIISSSIDDPILVKTLISMFNINQATIDKRMALYKASYNTELVKYFTEKFFKITELDDKEKDLELLFKKASRGAIENKNFELIKYLETKYSNFQDQYKSDKDYVYWAYVYEAHEILKYYKSYGLDLEKSDRMIPYLAKRKDIDLLKKYIELGFDINFKDLKGLTAFNYIAQSGNIDLLKFLKEKGANIVSSIAVEASLKLKNIEMLQFLLEDQNQRVNFNFIRPLLDETSLLGLRKPINLEIFKILKEKRDRIDGFEDNWNLSYSAILFDDVDLQDNIGKTALMWAIIYENKELVELILSKNPDVYLRDNFRRTALIHAIRMKNKELVELILSKNPDVNIQDNDGQTALMWAITTKNKEIVELILSKNPNVNIRDNDGRTAFDYASYYNINL